METNPKTSSLNAVHGYWQRSPRSEEMKLIIVQLAAREGNTPEDIAEMAQVPLDQIKAIIAADPRNQPATSS